MLSHAFRSRIRIWLRYIGTRIKNSICSSLTSKPLFTALEKSRLGIQYNANVLSYQLLFGENRFKLNYFIFKNRSRRRSRPRSSNPSADKKVQPRLLPEKLGLGGLRLRNTGIFHKSSVKRKVLRNV